MIEGFRQKPASVLHLVAARGTAPQPCNPFAAPSPCLSAPTRIFPAMKYLIKSRCVYIGRERESHFGPVQRKHIYGGTVQDLSVYG